MPITINELSNVEKQLQLEQSLIKKYTFFSSLCSDLALKLICEQIAAEHQNHYNSLLKHLN